jgi:hypothetical protein
MENRIFRVIFRRAKGFLPWLPAELVASGVPAIPLFVTRHPLIGLGIWAIGVGALVAWRRSDGDRADYARVWWRRWREPSGWYAAGRDTGEPVVTGGEDR